MPPTPPAVTAPATRRDPATTRPAVEADDDARWCPAAIIQATLDLAAARCKAVATGDSNKVVPLHRFAFQTGAGCAAEQIGTISVEEVMRSLSGEDAEWSLASRLRREYAGDGEHPNAPVRRWRGAVIRGETTAGYWDWLADTISTQAEPDPAQAVVAGVRRNPSPHWQPLERIAPAAVCAQFMYMADVDLADGRTLYAYKHRDTRRYLHLAHDGTTWCVVPGGYQPARASWACLAQARLA